MKRSTPRDGSGFITRLRSLLGPCHLFPPGNFPPTRMHTLFLNEYISLIREFYMNVKYLENCLYNCFDTSGKNTLIFDIMVQTSKNSRLEQDEIQ